MGDWEWGKVGGGPSIGAVGWGGDPGYLGVGDIGREKVGECREGPMVWEGKVPGRQRFGAHH